MTTWADLAKFKGYRVSPEFLINLKGDGVLTKITWDAEIPLNTEMKIETSLSFDSGVNWTSWKEVINGGLIPDTYPNTTLFNTLLRYRVFQETTDKNLTPRLKSVSFYFEPVIEFVNKGDVKIRPEIWITKIGNGDISIINTSNNNKEFKFTDLVDGETVYINGDREYIESDLALTYRYDNFNDEYLELVFGSNILRVIGSAKIQFRYQQKYIQ